MTKKTKAKKKTKRSTVPRRTESGTLVESTESLAMSDGEEVTDETNGPKKCPHLKSAVRITRLSRSLPSTLAKGAFCTTCKKEDARQKGQTKNNKSATSETELSVEENAEGKASTEPTTLWLCLKCGQANCGRQDKAHAVAHYDGEHHEVAINIETLECWCYACDEEVIGTPTHNQLAIESKQMVEKILKPKNASKVTVAEPKPITKKLKKYPINAPGLNNLGNTCFFNSVMQCIAYTQPLFDRLKTADEENQLVKGPFTGALYGFLNQMKATGETGGTVNPRDLFSCLSNTWRIYRMYGQQDSHELLRRLLDGVREEQLKKDENDKTIPNQRTLVENCFGGELVQAIVCDRCKHVSYSLEEYMDLSLPIAAEAKARGGLLGALSRYRSKSPSPTSSVEKTAKEVVNSVIDDVVDKLGNLTLDPIANSSPYTTDQKHLVFIDTLLQTLAKPQESNGDSKADTPATLEKCLADFMGVETLEGDSAYACDYCYKLKYGVTPEEERAAAKKAKDDAAALTPSPTDLVKKTEDEDDVKKSEDEDTVKRTEDEDTVKKSEDEDDVKKTEGEDTVKKTEDEEAVMKTENEDADKNSEDEDAATSRSSEEETVVQAEDVVTVTSSESVTTEVAVEEDIVAEANTNKDLELSTGAEATTTVAAPITIVEPRQRICNRAFKRYLLHSVPDVLVVQLKRFQSSGFAGRTKKCDDPVIFQEFLDLQPFMAPAAVDAAVQNADRKALGHRESGRYRLNGVVVHGGGLFSGHYTAYVRILQNATLAKQQSALGDDDNDAVIEWAYCSDTNVRASTIEEVLCSQAYLLLYERMAESVGR